MSKLRPELSTGNSASPCPSKDTALFLVYKAVQRQPGLIHGQLHRDGMHCALGSYWTVNPRLAFPHELTDEVAMVNDSVPHLNFVQRKVYMLRWLKWQLQRRGYVFRGRKVQQPASVLRCA